MAISEQLVIKARLDLSGVASDIDKLRSQLESANKVSASSLDVEAKKAALLDARLAKEQASIDKINALKEQQALKDQAKLDAQIAKQESAAQRDAARKEQAAARDQARLDAQIAKQESSSARLLAQLEKQDAAAKTKFTQGNLNGNNADQKDAIRRAKIYEEEIRLRQQLNSIKNTAFSDSDRARAEAFAQSISKINVDKINKDFGQTNVGTRTFIGNMQDASAQLQVLAGKLNEIKGNAQAAFAELDTARKKLSTISDDANGLVKALGKVAETNKFQATTAQLAGAAYEVQSAGFTKTADTTKILEASLRGSVGGFSDVTTVSKAAISVLNAYGLGADQASATIDKFTSVQQSGLITVDQYASQISKVAPIAAAAGVSLDQLNGFIATSTASGVPVEATFSGLRQALASTIKPTKQASDEAERLGISFGPVALRAKGLNGILADVKKSGLATGDTFSKLFGSIEAVAAIQPAINNLGKLEANIKASGESAGLTDKNFNKAASSLKGFANEAQDALAQLGERISSTASFNPIIVSTRALITAFRSLPEPAQNIIAIAVGLGASFVAVSAGITGILAVTQPTIAAFGLMATAIFGKAAADVTATGTAGASTAATVAQGVAQTTASLATKAAAIATGLYTLATTPLTGSLVLANAQLVIKNIQLGLVAARTGVAAFATSGYAAATNVLTGSLTAATGAASALLIPLGLAAAAAGVLLVQLKANEIEASNDALKATGIGVDILGNTAASAALRTKNLSEKIKEASANGKKLTQEQLNDANRLKAANDLRIKQLADEAENVKKTKITDETKGTQEGQLKQLEITSNSLKAQNKSLEEQIALNGQNTKAIEKSNEVSKEKLADLKKQAIALREAKTQDIERGIKRTIDDGKLKRDIENAKIIADIQEKNDLKKADLNQKQQLATDALKEKNAIALQDRQRTFDDAQGTKKQQREEAIDAKKRENELKLQGLQQAFDDRQAKAKEQRAEKQRQDDEKFANARTEREKKNNEASAEAKQAIADEGKIATAKPEDKAKIAAQIAEENRIRAEAKSQGVAGEQSQDQLIAKAKALARVSAIATQEEQTKVQLALDALESANKIKQAEIDKAEDKARSEAKRAEDKAFDEQQKLDKKVFETGLKAEALAFEQTVLKPEKIKLEKELQADKLLFERGELALLKKQQAQEERSLKLQQETEDRELKKKADAELDGIKQAQKAKDLEIDRKFEDEKIARERSFKEEQRNLDKASAIEIQKILSSGKGDAKNNTVPTKIPAFANGGVSSGGIALVGERGAELVNLPRGASVTPAIATQSLLSKSGDNSRVEALLERLIGSLNRPNLAIQTSEDPAAIASNIYRNMAIQEAQRSGI